MKNIALKLSVVLAGAVLAASALAQNTVVTANVPFAFSVQNKVLPAGRYEIQQFNSRLAPDGVLIRNIDHPEYSAVALVSVTPDQARGEDIADVRLVFDNSGGQHFLREVSGPAYAVNATFPVTATQKTVQNQKEASQPMNTTASAGQ